MPKGSVFGHFSGKRLIGALSWHLRRKHMHLPQVANAIRDSILATRPDHVAFTGDLVNIAGWNEFPPAATWLHSLGRPAQLSMTPGNHDAYVQVPEEKGMAHFAPWMQSDKIADGLAFPFVRLRRNVALIGCNSASPQSYRKAGGTLGQLQLRDISNQLEMLGQKGFFRILMIHHPPLPGLAIDRKALTDATALQEILVARGCELVLHGHNHQAMVNWLQTSFGPCPVVGVPSASMTGNAKHQSAAWNQYNIRRHQNRWHVEMIVQQWNSNSSKVETQSSAMLLPA